MDTETTPQSVRGRTHGTHYSLLMSSPFSFEKVSSARDEVMQFLEYQVAERKAALSGFPDGSEERSIDMFSMLVSANEAESDKVKMSDEEVVGNIFAMLFAGNGE